MPTYNYKCKSCSNAFELFQGIKEPQKKKCKKCGKHSLVRLIGAGGGVIFKGAGFFCNDYKNK